MLIFHSYVKFTKRVWETKGKIRQPSKIKKSAPVTEVDWKCMDFDGWMDVLVSIFL